MTDYQYKESGMVWLGEIPAHWEVKRLGGMGVFSKGGGISKSDLTKEGLDVILYGDLYTKYDINAVEIKNKISEEIAKEAKVLEYGDILFTGSGETAEEIGKTVVFQGDNKTHAGGDLIIFKPQNHDSLFLSYALNSETSLFQKARAAKGDIVVHIYSKNLRNLYLPIPPLPEQKAIADYLDSACQKIDRVIAKKEKQIEKIEKIRKNKIDEVVRFGLEANPDFDSTDINYIPKIKKGWNLDRFKDVAILRKEKTGKKTEEKNYIELEDIEQGTGRLLGKKDTTEVESDVTLFRYDDVLFGKLRPYLEKYHHADFDGKCTGEILAFKPLRIKGKFLMYIIASKWFIDLCNSMSYGAKMPRVNWPTQLSQVKLPLPSEEEQQEIVSYLDNLSNKVFKSIKNIEGQINTLHKYKKSLIHECVTGKKQVFEATIGRSKSEQVA